MAFTFLNYQCNVLQFKQCYSIIHAIVNFVLLHMLALVGSSVLLLNIDTIICTLHSNLCFIGKCNFYYDEYTISFMNMCDNN